MRGFLFHLAANFFGFQILIVSWVSKKLLRILGLVGYWAMKTADPKRLALHEGAVAGGLAEGPSSLQAQSMELRLLSSAGQVRDHAKESGDWTEHHTEALNAIGNALMNDHGWEEDSVHQYLKSLVESIDGLEYGKEEW